MLIHIGLVAYALDITPLVMALNGPDVIWSVYQHSEKEDVIRRCMELKRDISPFLYFDYRKNRGLSTSWNDSLIFAQSCKADVSLILNDDLVMSRDDMLTMANAAVEHREAGIIVAEGQNLRMSEYQILGYAAFAVNPVALEKVGLFDQNLVPYCYEDSDYSRRCALAGVTFHNAGRTGIIHAGSATVATVRELNVQHQRTFPASREYYVRKWNGDPGSETFTEPFSDPQFGLKIAAEQRNNPYPGYQRTDLDIVRI